jgi:hypothetical protein
MPHSKSLYGGSPFGWDGWMSALAAPPWAAIGHVYAVLLQQPLVLLRLVDAADLGSGAPTPTLVDAPARALGVTLLGFSLLAFKRLYSYREDKKT